MPWYPCPGHVPGSITVPCSVHGTALGDRTETADGAACSCLSSDRHGLVPSCDPFVEGFTLAAYYVPCPIQAADFNLGSLMLSGTLVSSGPDQ